VKAAERLPSPVITTAELARLLRVSETQVRRLNLPAVELGRGRWRYVLEQVLDELKRRAERGVPSVQRRVS
jgi:hypothetical protein